MKYFKVDTLGDADEMLACIDRAPKELGIKDYYMARGETIGGDYPKKSIMQLNEYSGFILRSLIGNIIGYLIVDTLMKQCIEQSKNNEIEYLPFILLNHKGKEHSTDYWIINPIGSVDALDIENSIVRRGKRTGEIVGIKEAVFNNKSLENAPDLFRIPQKHPNYYVSERLVECWRGIGATNVLLTEIRAV